MADVYGTNYTATYVNGGRIGANYSGGAKRVLYDTYEASTLADGSDIVIGKLPELATITDVKIFCDALGAGTTLGVSLRDLDANETVVMAAQSSASAAVLEPVAADIANLPADVGTVIDANSTEGVRTVDVIVPLVGAAATGTIKVFIEYTVVG